MTQVLDRPPVIDKSTGQRFYLLAVSLAPTLYWGGHAWSSDSDSAKGFGSYAAASAEKPTASRKAPVGASVIVSEL